MVAKPNENAVLCWKEGVGEGGRGMWLNLIGTCSNDDGKKKKQNDNKCDLYKAVQHQRCPLSVVDSHLNHAQILLHVH